MEHHIGTCAVCGEKRRLYLNADWCTRCLRKPIDAGGTERLLERREAAAERQAAEQERAEREVRAEQERIEREARYAADRPAREARAKQARIEREARAEQDRGRREARLEQLRRAAKASPYEDPEMLIADLEGQGFTVDEMQSIADELEEARA